MTLQYKTTRIIYIDNINNLFLISACASNDFFNNLRGNQLPAALKESHVSVNKYINPFFRLWDAALWDGVPPIGRPDGLLDIGFSEKGCNQVVAGVGPGVGELGE